MSQNAYSLSDQDQRRARHIREHRRFVRYIKQQIADEPGVNWQGYDRRMRRLARQAGLNAHELVPLRLLFAGISHLLAVVPDRLWFQTQAKVKLKTFRALACQAGIKFTLIRQSDFDVNSLLRTTPIAMSIAPHTPTEFVAALPPGHSPSP